MRNLAFLVLLAAPLAAQDWNRSHTLQDLEGFIAQSYPNQSKLSTSAVYRAARTRGWLRDATSRNLIKRQLRALAKKKGSGRFLDLRARTALPGPPSGPMAAVKEVEYNDCEAYANDLGVLVAPLIATGALSGNADTDSFRFTTLYAGVATFTTTYSGATPDLMITSATGDECWGYHYYDPNKVVLPLPAGTYHVRLGASSTPVTYSLTLSLKNQAIPTLALGKTTVLSTGPNPAAVKLVLPQDGRIKLALSSAGLANSYLLLQNDKWGYIYDCDDASTSSKNGHAGLDAQLPKGTYYVYIWTDQTRTISVNATFSTVATPLLTTSTNGILKGSQESFDLYRIVTTKTEQLDLTLVGNGASAIKDPYLILYDRNMVEILEGDDRDQDTLSVLSAVLPAGVYYVCSNAYWEHGGYKITRGASTVPVKTAQAGINPSGIPLARNTTQTYRFSVRTPSWVEFDVVQGNNFDAQLGVIDAFTGLALGWEDDENMGPEDCNLGMHLPAGDYFLFVREYGGVSGSFDARVLPPLQRWAGDNVMVLGHGGNPLFFLVSTKSAAPSNPLPGILSGFLLLDLPSAIIIPMAMPANGRIDFKASLKPNSGLFLQMADFDARSGAGVFSNLLK